MTEKTAYQVVSIDGKASEETSFAVLLRLNGPTEEVLMNLNSKRRGRQVPQLRCVYYSLEAPFELSSMQIQHVIQHLG